MRLRFSAVTLALVFDTASTSDAFVFPRSSSILHRSTCLFSSNPGHPFSSYYGNPGSASSSPEEEQQRYSYGPSSDSSTFYASQTSQPVGKSRSDSPAPSFEDYFRERQRATGGTTSVATKEIDRSTPTFPSTSFPSPSHPASKATDKPPFRVETTTTPRTPSSTPIRASDLTRSPPKTNPFENKFATPPPRPYAAMDTTSTDLPKSPLDMYNTRVSPGAATIPQGNMATSTPTVSTELQQRLEQLAQQNTRFHTRLDGLETKLETQQQTTMEYTQQALEKFRTETQKTNEHFFQTVTTDIAGMKTTLQTVLKDQTDLKNTQLQQKTTLDSLKQSQDTHKEKLTTLERSNNIRMTNLEKTQLDSVQKYEASLKQMQQSQQESVENVTKTTAKLEQDTQERMTAFEEAQKERLSAFEEYQQERIDAQLATHVAKTTVAAQSQQPGRPTFPMEDPQLRRNNRMVLGDEGSMEDDYQDEDDQEPPSPPRSMLRDRLMGARGGGETLYNKKMKQDLAKPPVPMGPLSEKERRRQQDRRNRDFPENEFMDEMTDVDTVHALGKYRSFQGDEPLPKEPFGNSAGMGRFQGPVDSQPWTPGSKNAGSYAGPMAAPNKPEKKSPPPQRSTERPSSPPNTPMIDRKLQHFLQETIENGPKPHFDKEMESLLMEKYQPHYDWLKNTNVQFIRSVLTTFLEHKGAQVEMDLRDASEQAAYEWDELMHILSLELHRITGEEPRIEAEGNNQWGIYGGRGMSSKTKQRRRNVNNKAYVVSEGAP
jgi:hypothetical protein